MSNDNEDKSEEMENEAQETVKRSRLSFIAGHKVLTILLVFIVGAGLGIGSHFVLTPLLANHNAQNVLEGLKDNSGTIQPINTEVKTFAGQSIKGANVDQKELSGGGTDPRSAVFVFGNGKDVKDRKTVDVYLDFSSQNSRDFLLLNQTALKSLVENGKILLRIRPVPTGSAFAMYAPEAVAESISFSPGKTWDTLLELLKAGATLNTDKGDDVVSTVVETSNKAGVSDITKETIEGGTFASWIIAVGDEKDLSTGYYPPILYVNGNEIKPDDVNFNDSNDLTRAILK